MANRYLGLSPDTPVSFVAIKRFSFVFVVGRLKLRVRGEGLSGLRDVLARIVADVAAFEFGGIGGIELRTTGCANKEIIRVRGHADYRMRFVYLGFESE